MVNQPAEHKRQLKSVAAAAAQLRSAEIRQYIATLDSRKAETASLWVPDAAGSRTGKIYLKTRKAVGGPATYYVVPIEASDKVRSSGAGFAPQMLGASALSCLFKGFPIQHDERGIYRVEKSAVAIKHIALTDIAAVEAMGELNIPPVYMDGMAQLVYEEAKCHAQLYDTSGVAIQGDRAFLVMPLVQKSRELLRENLTAQEKTPKGQFTIAKRLAKRLETLSRLGIVHRDIRGSNILIDGASEIHVIDYGAALKLPSAEPGYRHAESEQAGTRGGITRSKSDQKFHYGLKFDVYHMGLTLLDTLGVREDSKKALQYTTMGEPDVDWKKLNVPDIDDLKLKPLVQNFLSRMLRADVDYDERPDSQEVLAFFTHCERLYKLVEKRDNQAEQTSRDEFRWQRKIDRCRSFFKPYQRLTAITAKVRAAWNAKENNRNPELEKKLQETYQTRKQECHRAILDRQRAYNPPPSRLSAWWSRQVLKYSGKRLGKLLRWLGALVGHKVSLQSQLRDKGKALGQLFIGELDNTTTLDAVVPAQAKGAEQVVKAGAATVVRQAAVTAERASVGARMGVVAIPARQDKTKIVRSEQDQSKAQKSQVSQERPKAPTGAAPKL